MKESLDEIAARLAELGIEEVIIKTGLSVDPLLEELTLYANSNALSFSPSPLNPNFEIAAYTTNNVKFYFL